MDKSLYTGFLFSTYFSNYCSKRGIQKSFIAELLGINSNTCRSKFLKDCFSYHEICYLDFYFSDLHYLENKNNYLTIRASQNRK